VYRQARKVALWHRLQAHASSGETEGQIRRRRARASRSGGRNGAAADNCLQGECRFPVLQSASRAARPRRAAKVMIYADPTSPTRPPTAAHCTTSFRSAARPDPPSPHDRRRVASRLRTPVAGGRDPRPPTSWPSRPSSKHRLPILANSLLVAQKRLDSTTRVTQGEGDRFWGVHDASDCGNQSHDFH
jgi:hypothetical protein